jgi:hypothetical protein
MPSQYYLGTTPEESLGDSPKYFYAMRRNADGELYLARSNQILGEEPVAINNPDSLENTYDDLEAGVDFFDGIDSERDVVYPGLKYSQYKWDNRSIFYYVDADGYLVMRVNKGYTYPSGISSNG